MFKITFLGAGSTVFAKNVLGDCILTPELGDFEIALFDIDPERMEDSRRMLESLNKKYGGRAVIRAFSDRREASFVVNAVQVGGYRPCTVTDFEIPKKYGLRQTIGDTLGIGGIFRALRTFPVLDEFAEDIHAVCPRALFLNYTNPMAILSGYMQRYTGVRTVGLCHSVQSCSEHLLTELGMQDKLEGRRELIAGINHMAWLLELRDRDGNDLYPEIRRLAKEKNMTEKHNDMVRFDYIDKFGYYCTESSEHNAEYNMFYIKSKYPERIERFNIPLDEYPRRCVNQIAGWAKERDELRKTHRLGHTRTAEYASHIMEAMVTNKPYQIGGNVLNRGGLIENLPEDACVEVPCLINGMGLYPCHVGRLPVQCAAMNMTNINVQLLTIEAAVTRKKEHIYQAAMLDPHTGSELDIDTIIEMVDALIDAHGDWLPKYH